MSMAEILKLFSLRRDYFDKNDRGQGLVIKRTLRNSAIEHLLIGINKQKHLQCDHYAPFSGPSVKDHRSLGLRNKIMTQ